MREHFGEILIEADLFCHPLRHEPVVPGEHHAPDTHRFQPGDRFPRFFPDDIGERKDSHRPLVFKQEDNRFTLPGHGFDPLIRNLDMVFLQISRADHLHVPSCNKRFDTFAGNGMEFFYRDRIEMPIRGTLHNAPGDRVFGICFKRCGHLHHVGFAELSERENIRYAEYSFGQGTGFIKDYCLDILRPFECLPFPDEQTGPGRK